MALRSRDMPSVNALIIFEVAARKLSFTEASHELGITQAAVSRQILTLEEHLGCLLFRRLHRKVVLTPQGAGLAESLLPAFNRIEEAVRLMLPGRRPVELVIAATSAFSHFWLMPRIGRFRAQHPDVTLRIVTYETLSNLDREGIDVAIHYGSSTNPMLEMRHLLDETVIVVCSADYAGKLVMPIPLDELHCHSLISLDPRERSWISWEDWMTAFGRPSHPTQLGTRCSSYIDAISVALSGHGLAIGWSRLIDDLLASGHLVKACAETLQTEFGYRVLVFPRKQINPAVNAFTDWIHQEGIVTLTGEAQRLGVR